MTALLLMLLSQAPALTPPPPSPEVTPLPVAAAEAPEVKLFAEFVERHLLAVDASNAGFTVRQRERVFRLQDDDFEEAFALVPEALAAARLAHADYVTGMRLQIASLIVLGVALGITAVAPIIIGVSLTWLIISLGATGVGLVLALVALPFLLSAQTKFFSSAASYNRGLLELRPPPAVMPGGLTFPLPN